MATALAVLAGSCRDVAVTAVDIFRVTVEPATDQITIGQTLQLSVRLTDASGRELSRRVSWSGSTLTDRVPEWSSSDTRIATVRSDGRVRALAVATAVVSATVEGVTGVATVTVRASSGLAGIATVSDTLPANADFADASGSYLRAGNIVTWNAVLLAPGDSIIETVRIVTKNPSNVTNTAAVCTIEVTNAGPDTPPPRPGDGGVSSNVAFVDVTDAISPDAAGVLAWAAVPGLARGEKLSFSVRVTGATASAESATVADRPRGRRPMSPLGPARCMMPS